MRPDDVPPARVLRHPLGHWIDPAVAWSALLADETSSFWLDSGQGTGTSYLGAGSSVITGDDVLDRLRTGLADNRVADAAADGFALGWVGWLGYELRAATMGVPVHRASRYPTSAFMFVDRALAFDHDSGEVTLLALGTGWSDELLDWRQRVVEALAGTGRMLRTEPASEAAPASATAPATATWAYSDDEYLGMIEACQRAIHAGDAYQLCLTTEASVEGAFDPFATYLELRASSPAHHGGLLRIGGVALLSASPEQFLTVSPDGVVESRPIKGTRRRGASPAEDAELRAELLASDKERAENLMIVDLMRNDIGRVSALGTVVVPALFAVETYRHVHQLVSTVRGTLAPGLDAVDAVRACFPAGSMTGAPKRSATHILDRLEHRARGIYAGSFGYFGLDGRVDLAMVIRSIVIDDRGASLGTGGGITALSVPADELDEMHLKAAALLAVLGA
ncbi:MAG: aminodeoxychorismate synthase component [Microbacteriaceae bacterium]|jgi:para-aminobenzoate synthetase component 1|nr:aminodeoxychorismate synthase component [Microbacteriaceae bacterium]